MTLVNPGPTTAAMSNASSRNGNASRMLRMTPITELKEATHVARDDAERHTDGHCNC